MLVSIPIFLFILPGDFFDHGKPNLSIFGQLGLETYYSKGMTRGVMHFIHFEFSQAWGFNKISVFVAPLLIVMWAWALVRTLSKTKLKKQK